jgi:hypothetical protein
MPCTNQEYWLKIKIKREANQNKAGEVPVVHKKGKIRTMQLRSQSFGKAMCIPFSGYVKGHTERHQLGRRTWFWQYR